MHRICGLLKNSALVLLSGEGTTLPLAEARALFLSEDPHTSFKIAQYPLLLAETEADPFAVGSRIAFARRVGRAVDSPAEAAEMLHGRRVRVRVFDIRAGLPDPDEGSYLEGIDATIDLKAPQLELTVVRGDDTYFAVSDPMSMKQGWSRRRPRQRRFFHPSAIFPKLARALVNMTRCKPGEVFLDPFAGTGSLTIEADMVGAAPIAVDLSERMTVGSLRNMHQFSQEWLGVIRSDSFKIPVTRVGAIATDVPYGRAASTGGRPQGGLLGEALEVLPGLLEAGRRMVVMHSDQTQVESTSKLELEEEHSLYVHKLLTRTISIFRRR